jgi:hypothetical protein
MDLIFDAAEQGQDDVVSLHTQDVRTRMTHLWADSAREKLQLSLNAAQRASFALSNARRRDSLLTAPVAPQPPDERRGATADYARQRDLYEQRKAEFDKKQEAKSAETAKVVGDAMGQARDLASQAYALLDSSKDDAMGKLPMEAR